MRTALAHRWLRVPVLVGIWIGSLAAALAIARFTKAGPILVVVSSRHGVHAGDLVAFAAVFSVAAVLSSAVVRWWNAHRGTPPEVG